MPSVQSPVSPSGLDVLASPISGASAGRWVETDQDSINLARKEQPERSKGILARLGTLLMRPFNAIREWIAHLLSDKRREADEDVPAPVPPAKYYKPEPETVQKDALTTEQRDEPPALPSPKPSARTTVPVAEPSPLTATSPTPLKAQTVRSAPTPADEARVVELAPVVAKKKLGPPISPLSLPGAGDASYKEFIGKTVASLEVAATVLGKKHKPGHRIAKEIRSIVKPPADSADNRVSDKEIYKALFKQSKRLPIAHGSMSPAPEQAGAVKAPKRNKGVFHKIKKTAGLSKPPVTQQVSGDGVRKASASEMGKGLNALYLNGYGRAATAQSVRGLVADKEQGVTKVQALTSLLARTGQFAASYRPMRLEAVINALSDGEHLLEPGDALAAFIGGVVSFADSFETEHAENIGEKALQAAGKYVERSVSGLLRAMSSEQKKIMKAMLTGGLAAQAHKIFAFAKEQVLPGQRDLLNLQLSRLGFGTRVMDRLMTDLGLPLQAAGSINVDEFDVNELAALSRVLMAPDRYTADISNSGTSLIYRKVARV